MRRRRRTNRRAIDFAAWKERFPDEMARAADTVMALVGEGGCVSLREAGGTISGMQGSDDPLKTGHMVCGNEHVHGSW